METNISKLKSIIESTGQCEFSYNETIKDYNFNGKDVVNFKEDYYIN